MNTDQLKKNVGQDFRLRPHPLEVEWTHNVRSTGVDPATERRLVKTDYLWRLTAVTSASVSLHCHHSNHDITLGNDNVREYRTPDFLLLKCQLTLDGKAVHIEPILERGGRAGAKNEARAYVVLRSDSVELQHAINVRSVKVAHVASHRPYVHVVWDTSFADAFYNVSVGSVEYILGPVSWSIAPYTKTAGGLVLEFVDSIGGHMLPSAFHIEAAGD